MHTGEQMVRPISTLRNELDKLVFSTKTGYVGSSVPAMKTIFIDLDGKPIEFCLRTSTLDVATHDAVHYLPTVQRIEKPFAPGQKHNIVLSILDSEVIAFFSHFDALVRRKVHANAHAWFRKKPNPSDLHASYKPMLRPANEIHPASLRAKIAIENADVDKNTRIYVADSCVEEGEELTYVDGDLTDLEPGSHVLCILQCNCLWTREVSAGVSFTAKELVVWKAHKLKGVAAFGWNGACSFAAV